MPDRRHARAVPGLDQRRGDRAGGGVGEVDDHGRLQVRPSRASISLAACGPQVPAGYCSGWPCAAQYSSIGSRIRQDSSTSSVPREQRRLAEQHVEDQPLVRLRAGLGERLAVGEVHRDVADLHRGAGHLGAEPQREALVRLHPDDQRVLAELLGRGRLERQVRGPLEDDGDLGDPAAEPLAGAQVERHAGPAAGVDVQPDGGVGLGDRLRRDAVLLQVADDLHAALPAGGVLPAGRAGRPGRSGSRTAESTFSFSIRTASASNETGSSIAVSASSCSRWFWMTSRAAPMPS